MGKTYKQIVMYFYYRLIRHRQIIARREVVSVQLLMRRLIATSYVGLCCRWRIELISGAVRSNKAVLVGVGQVAGALPALYTRAPFRPHRAVRRAPIILCKSGLPEYRVAPRATCYRGY